MGISYYRLRSEYSNFRRFCICYPLSSSKALAKNGKRSLLTLGVALAGGLAVTHHTVPPTPGPLGVAGLFGVDIGAMLLTGMCMAFLPVVGIVLYAKWLDKKYLTLIKKCSRKKN